MDVLKQTLTATAILFFSSTLPNTNADLITFEGHGNDTSFEPTQDGYKFSFRPGSTPTAQGFGIFQDNFVPPSDNPEYVRNGTTRLVASGDSGGSTARVLITPQVALTFSLLGFDAATMFTMFPIGGIEVTGNLNGGGTVVATFVLTNSFASYDLPDTFTNLSSVQVRDTFSGDFGKEPGFSLDNLEINAVPEPSMLVLSVTAGLALVISLSPQLRRRLSANSLDS